MDQNVVEIILNVQKEVAGVIIDALTPIFGAKVRLYYPIAENSVYGQKGNQFTYNNGYDSSGNYDPANDVPDYDGRLIVTGVFSRRLQSDESVDPYDGEEVWIFVKGEDDVPKFTQAFISWHDVSGNPKVVHTYRVLETEGPFGVDGQLYRKVRLVPQEYRFITA